MTVGFYNGVIPALRSTEKRLDGIPGVIYNWSRFETGQEGCVSSKRISSNSSSLKKYLPFAQCYRKKSALTLPFVLQLKPRPVAW